MKCEMMAKAMSTYKEEIAHIPIEQTSFEIIRGGFRALNTGPHLTQALVNMAQGGAMYATINLLFIETVICENEPNICWEYSRD